jgi:phenylalanyl-tRNA synthetase alpha chain
MNKDEFTERIARLAGEALKDIEASETPDELEKARGKHLGSKAPFGELSKKMTELPKEDRPVAGKLLGEARRKLETAKLEKEKELSRVPDEGDFVDVTLPGRRVPVGHRNLINKTTAEICGIFAKLGLSVVEGPEVETDWYNFQALNFPPDHPSRDMQQTLFVGDKVLLRTHTSGVQIRTMEKTSPPVWIVVPGKTYRRDDDLTHSPMFNQIEGLVVDKGITMADLKGVLTAFAREFFSPDTKIRLRPSFFPFTEPSAEVDIRCVKCGGSGCRICKGTGWLEVLGSGMVNPALYEFVNYDPSRVSGFAFGMGVDRMAMLKYGLDNISRFYKGDVRYMSQFPA